MSPFLDSITQPGLSLGRLLLRRSLLAVPDNECAQMSPLLKTAHKIKFYLLALYYLLVVFLAYPLLMSRAQSCPPPKTPVFAKCSVVYYSGQGSFFYAAAAPQFTNAFNAWTGANATQNNSQVVFVPGVAPPQAANAGNLSLVQDTGYDPAFPLA